MNSGLRNTLGGIASHPALGPVGTWARRRAFPGSAAYWERRYAAGGTSGQGSAGRPAEWKAEIANRWVKEQGVTSVVDFGCGDGQQLALADYPRYLGLDPSGSAVKLCIERFKGDQTKSFLSLPPGEFADPARWLRGDLALSMEVLFHLVEEQVYQDYLEMLFDSAERYVLICSNDTVGSDRAAHERHRSFTAWIASHRPDWSLLERVDPPSDVALMSSMYLYSKSS